MQKMTGNLLMTEMVTDSLHGKTISFLPYTIYIISNKLKIKCKTVKVEKCKFINTI